MIRHLNYKDGITDVENLAQTKLRDFFFDQKVFECTASSKYLKKRTISKYARDYKQNNYKFNDTIRSSDGSVTSVSITMPEDMVKTEYITDIANKRDITILHDDSIVNRNCEDIKLDDFIVTKNKKKIAGWDCIEWIPKEKKWHGQVSVWICKELPKQIAFSYISDDFNGGIVEVDIARGFSYCLTGFEKIDSKGLELPDLNCDSISNKKYDFLVEILNDKIGLDIKYRF